MLRFLERIAGRHGSGSKQKAKDRLRLVLVHDRTSISGELLETLKVELIEVISKYMEIDEEGLEVNLDRDDDEVALVANIPIRNVKRALQGANR